MLSVRSPLTPLPMEQSGSTVVKLKGVNPDLFRISAQQCCSAACSIFDLTYDGGTFFAQLPRCTISRELYEEDGKYYVEVLAARGGRLYDFVRAFGRFVEARVRDITDTGHTLVDHMRVSRSDGDTVHRVRIKVPRQRSHFQCRVCDAEQGALSVAHLRQGVGMLAVVEIRCVYVVGGICGYHMQLREARVLDGEAE